MTPDPKEFNRLPAPRTSLEVACYGQSGGIKTHDEVCAAKEQGWRLMCGPEPSPHIAPGPLLRYGPYC